MARRKTKKAPAAPSLARFLPIAILIALVIFVGAVVSVFFMSPEPGVFHYPLAENATGCIAGQARNCSVGGCTGTSLCLEDGTWGSCNWQRVCTPGSTLPCLQDGCAYAYKTCNPCGSGYGDCNASRPATSDTG
jgi:hypothetical protein